MLVSEGKKCADDAAGFDNYASVTRMGGCNALSQTDLTPLARRDVIILPDHDELGQAAATQLEHRLREVGAASIRRLDIVRLAENCGLKAVAKFDMADAIAAGLDTARFDNLLAMPGMLIDVVAKAAQPAGDFAPLPEDPVQCEILA